MSRLLTRGALALVAAILTLSLFSTSASAAVAWPTLSLGSSGENVVTLQAMLRQAGYTVTYSGSFDSATQTAVQRFQTDNALSSTGSVDAATWEKLASRSSSVVRQGTTNIVVEALQRQLKNRYGYNLTVDQAFGSGTNSKVVSFQKSVNQTADGIVGRNTWFHLISGDTERIRHTSALSQLQNAGISVVSSQNIITSDRTVSGSTSLEQVRQQSVSGLLNFKSRSGCAVTVTGGTENYVHSGGAYSHHTGYKIDISLGTCVSNYITGNFTYSGTRSDGATLYTDSATGYVYARESDHWDILFR